MIWRLVTWQPGGEVYGTSITPKIHKSILTFGLKAQWGELPQSGGKSISKRGPRFEVLNMTFFPIIGLMGVDLFYVETGPDAGL